MRDTHPNKRLREAVQSIRQSGMTVSGWARVHGFKPDTVFKILHGHYSAYGGRVARSIIEALGKEGFLEKDKG